MAAYQLPVRSVEIGGRCIKVSFNGKLDDCWGQYCRDGEFIELGPDVDSLKTFRDTMRHEMLHAAISVSGLNHILNDNLEEALVRALENLFLPAIDKLDQRLGLMKKTPS